MPVRIREGARAMATAGECLIYVGHSVCADSCTNANRLTSDEWVVLRGKAQRWQAWRLLLNAASQSAQMARAVLC
ncbi:MAG: hypothetical protein VYB84_06675 [Pseudomonadota bacterium]|nr:hypothetical protein [Pseudomonadota bacterium]